jgi:hypothetical protein
LVSERGPRCVFGFIQHMDKPQAGFHRLTSVGCEHKLCQTYAFICLALA